MDRIWKLHIVIVLFLSIGYILFNYSQVPELPIITVTYWGPGNEKPDDKTIRNFKATFPEKALEDLWKKIEGCSEFTPPLEGVGFQYGMNTDYLKQLIHFWKSEYNWTERVEYLNKFPQYTTQIGGLKIHFLHKKVDPNEAEGKQVLPLLILHGWPGSVREFFGIIPMLNSPRPDHDFVFEIIIPSLPGFTFSQGASKPGLGAAQIGAIMNELMARLGHQQYYIHGGDWGSAIGLSMSILFPNKVKGFHSTFCLAATPSARFYTFISYLFPQYFIEESMKEQFVDQFTDMYVLESGYLHIQSTKPDTIGVALMDSPVGLAAYFLEKFSTWTNRTWRSLPNGGIDNMNKVELLDNIMLYWLTNSVTTSMRIYSETFNRKHNSLGIERHISTVPTACAWFKFEVIYHPKIVLENAYKNLIQISHFPKGGHFSAYEEPKLVSDDIWKFVKSVRNLKK